MYYDTVYKLARAQDPSAAVASACAAVGFPHLLMKTSRLGSQVMQLVGKGARRGAGRVSKGMEGGGGAGRKIYKETAKSQRPRSLEIAHPRRGEIDVAELMDMQTGYRPTPISPHDVFGVRGRKRPVSALTGNAGIRGGDRPQAGSARAPSGAKGAGPEAATQTPGLGKRLAQNWWTVPAAGAGVYGLGHAVGQAGDVADMMGGGGAPEMDYDVPMQAAQTPADGRYQQMLQMARQYGYV